MPKGNWQSPRHLCCCGSVIVGHIPKKISPTFSLFLRRGGAIHCTVTGAKRYSADIEQGGLEVPCVLKFVGDREKLKFLLDETQKLVCYALSKDKVHLKQQSVNPNEESTSVSESDSVPLTKKIKLSESCETLTDWQRDMIKGEMLSDISVTTAQTLLKKQFSFSSAQENISHIGLSSFCLVCACSLAEGPDSITEITFELAATIADDGIDCANGP